MMDEAGAIEFENKLEVALAVVAKCLDNLRNPKLANTIHHGYDDLFALAEWCTNVGIASQLNALSQLGLSPDHVSTLREWVQQGQSVSLRFRSEETCEHSCTMSHDVEDPREYREERVSTARRISRAIFTSKVVTTVTEYLWDFKVKWQLCAVRGVGVDDGDLLVLSSNECEHTIRTSSMSCPRPEALVPAKLSEVDITWLISQLGGEAGSLETSFKVNRDVPTCKTPRRNLDVEKAIEHFLRYRSWSQDVCSVFFTNLFRVTGGSSEGKDTASLSSLETVFVPVVPLFEEKTAASRELPGSAEEQGSSLMVTLSANDIVAATEPPALSAVTKPAVCLSTSDASTFLSEEQRSLKVKLSEVGQAFPSDNSLISTTNGTICVVLRHSMRVCATLKDSLNFVEQMLRQHLVAAIGKHVTPQDMHEYTVFHNRKLFSAAYAPRPFSYDVRRTVSHSPEGSLSILSKAEPIMTMVSRAGPGGTAPMTFPLSASTNVVFNGERYLHAHLLHTFGEARNSTLELSASARQFSSMMVIVGTISSATSFEPRYASIVQNKDELTVPLELSTIPTPKEFKDATRSLSEKQRAFAKMFRGMQLASTLFGVLVVQIKPALEAILNLPADSLTKEIRLTQDLMGLFVDHHIPTDLLKYDANQGGGAGTGEASAIEAVKAHVSAINSMINEAKQEELKEAKLKAEAEALAMYRSSSICDSYRDSESDGDCWDEDEEEELLDLDPVKMCMTMEGMEEELMDQMCVRMEGMEQEEEVGMLQELETSMMDTPTSAAEPTTASPAEVPAVAPVVAPPAKPVEVAAARGDDFREADADMEDTGVGQARDYTKVPTQLNQRLELLDDDNCLRPTIIKPGEVWSKTTRPGLLAKPTTTSLDGPLQKEEKDKAFALLDAITKSGALHLDHAQMHVVVAATHSFDKSVTETVIQDNVSPIEKVEKSTLLLAMTVHERAVAELVEPGQLARVAGTSPRLLES